MPVTIIERVLAYKYDELTDKAKERAVRDWVETCDDMVTDAVTEAIVEGLNEAGYLAKSKHVHWSLSHSQGDGVAWYLDSCTLFDYDKLILRLIGSEEKDMHIAVERYFSKYDRFDGYLRINHRYCGRHHHYNSMTVEHLELDKKHAFYKHVEEFVERVRQDIKGLSRRHETVGYDIIDSYHSPEAMLDNFGDDAVFNIGGQFLGRLIDLEVEK